MAPWLRLAALPSSFLVFIASSAAPACSRDLDWPYILPPDVKYYPEDEFLVKRDMDIQEKLQRHEVTGIRKMSHDPGEKFDLAYWGMAEEGQETTYSSTWSNASMWTSFDQPIRVHSQYQNQTSIVRSWRRRLPGWHLFSKRGFQCPSGTSSCTSIDRPNSCCATGSTCQIVQDTGLGDVGCCPNGQTCADSLSTCESGYTSCPNNPGGGCCIPGYACYDVGCVQTSYATVSTQPAPAPTPSTTTVTSYTTITPAVTSPTTTSTSRSSSSSSSSPTTTLAPDISTITKTVTVTSTQNSLTCSSGYRSCPASLGGGCCPTDRSCGLANCPASTTTTTTSATAAPPVRPTTLTTTEETTTTTLSPKTSSPTRTSTSTSSTVIVTGCPTGFYACSAYYLGGCCQTGRNCDTTSCPPASVSTTLVSGSTLTIVAPSGSGITAPASVLTGSCAQGWATCSADLGGGCCPSGYQCGEVSCAAVATGGGGSSVGKMPPNAAGASLGVDLWTMTMAGLGTSLAVMLVMML